jgi:hypothetical protein
MNPSTQHDGRADIFTEQGSVIEGGRLMKIQNHDVTCVEEWTLSPGRRAGSSLSE